MYGNLEILISVPQRPSTSLGFVWKEVSLVDATIITIYEFITKGYASLYSMICD